MLFIVNYLKINNKLISVLCYFWTIIIIIFIILLAIIIIIFFFIMELNLYCIHQND